jgi:CRISPR system Cascade subunit CasA
VASNNDVALWRHERLPLPTAYLTNDDLLQKLAEALKLGEDAAGRLSSAVWVLAEKALLRAFVDSLAAERPYWAALDVPFRGLMVDLADAWTRDEEHVPMRAWATAVRDAASKAFGSVARSLETSARGLRAAAEARGRFEASLNQLVGPYIKTQGEEETV